MQSFSLCLGATYRVPLHADLPRLVTSHLHSHDAGHCVTSPGHHGPSHSYWALEGHWQLPSASSHVPCSQSPEQDLGPPAAGLPLLCTFLSLNKLWELHYLPKCYRILCFHGLAQPTLKLWNSQRWLTQMLTVSPKLCASGEWRGITYQILQAAPWKSSSLKRSPPAPVPQKEEGETHRTTHSKATCKVPSLISHAWPFHTIDMNEMYNVISPVSPNFSLASSTW